MRWPSISACGTSARPRNYLLHARRFAAFFMRSPEELGEAEIRQFLLHQIEVKGLSYRAYRQMHAALKFLYTVTLNRPWEIERIPFPKRQRRPLPTVLNYRSNSRKQVSG
jgi:hypothetical protein